MSVKMEMDVSGVSRAPISVLPAAAAEDMTPAATLRPDTPERPRCASTPCSPNKSTVSGYQILHMNSNYLVGFTTGEELLKLATKWSPGPDTPQPLEALPSPSPVLVPSLGPRPMDLGLHRTSRIYKAKTRYYQPYDIPSANGRRRRRMPSSGDPYLRSLSQGEGGGGGGGDRQGAGTGRALHHGPLPLCLLKGKRAQSKSLDYLNLDKMSVREPADTEVLQYQLQHLTLRGERLFTRNKT